MCIRDSTRDASRYELSLYRIDVPVTGQISITDERFNTAVCGEIRPKNLAGYKEMVEEFDRQFQAWFKNVQGTGWRNIFAQATEPGGADVYKRQMVGSGSLLGKTDWEYGTFDVETKAFSVDAAVAAKFDVTAPSGN